MIRPDFAVDNRVKAIRTPREAFEGMFVKCAPTGWCGEKEAAVYVIKQGIQGCDRCRVAKCRVCFRTIAAGDPGEFRKVLFCFQVDRDGPYAHFSEADYRFPWMDDHEMDIEWYRSALAKTVDDARVQTVFGSEGAVHDIEMQRFDIGDNGLDLLCQTKGICSIDRSRKSRHAAGAHAASRSLGSDQSATGLGAELQ